MKETLSYTFSTPKPCPIGWHPQMFKILKLQFVTKLQAEPQFEQNTLRSNKQGKHKLGVSFETSNSRFRRGSEALGSALLPDRNKHGQHRLEVSWWDSRFRRGSKTMALPYSQIYVETKFTELKYCCENFPAGFTSVLTASCSESGKCVPPPPFIPPPPPPPRRYSLIVDGGYLL